jgi:hypothetical protein
MTTTITPVIRHNPLTVKFAVKTNVSARKEVNDDLEKFLSKENIFKNVLPYNLIKLQKHGELSVDLEYLTDSELNIHLVRKNAIVITLKYIFDDLIIRDIYVDVGLLLYGNSECPVIESDIIAAHSIVIETVSAFAEDPFFDQFLIFPATWDADAYLLYSDEYYYQSLEASLIIPGVHVENLHFPADSRILPMRLSDNSIVWIDGQNEIRFENVSSVAGSGSVLQPQRANDRSTRLTLIVDYPEGVEESDDESRIFGLRHANIAARFHDLASSLEVVYLPLSSEDRRDDDVSMGGHAIAMDMALDGRLMGFIERALNPKPLVLGELRQAVASLTTQRDTVLWPDLLERAYALQAKRAINGSDWALHPYVKGLIC